MEGLVVEDVPAERAAATLVIENELTHVGWQLGPLPVPFCGPNLRRLAGRGASADGTDGVCRGPQIVGSDVWDGSGLPGGQRSELCRLWHVASGGICLEGQLTRVHHAHVTADPASAGLDGRAGPPVSWLLVLEQTQDVLGAYQRPFRQEPVVVVGQSPSATNRDESRIAIFGKDRHSPSRTTLASALVGLPAVGQGGHPRGCLPRVTRRHVDDDQLVDAGVGQSPEVAWVGISQ